MSLMLSSKCKSAFPVLESSMFHVHIFLLVCLVETLAYGLHERDEDTGCVAVNYTRTEVRLITKPCDTALHQICLQSK